MPMSAEEVLKKFGKDFDFTPYGQNVAAVLTNPVSERNGIQLPGGHSFDSPTYTVLAVGPDCKLCKVGDLIAISHGKFCGFVWRKGVEFAVFKEDTIEGVVKDLK